MRSLLSIVAIGTVLRACACLAAQGSGSSGSDVVRLLPAAFPNLPQSVGRELKRRGCRIPQNAYNKNPHNVITGEFARRGQTDWAVLCSIRGASSVLVFWNGDASGPAEIASYRDDVFIQDMGGGKWGFSRGISAVGRDIILRHGAAAGSATNIDHHGIDDAFIEKGSEVHYYDGNRWLKLPGAD